MYLILFINFIFSLIVFVKNPILMIFYIYEQ